MDKRAEVFVVICVNCPLFLCDLNWNQNVCTVKPIAMKFDGRPFSPGLANLSKGAYPWEF
jgi:hypothetical protein